MWQITSSPRQLYTVTPAPPAWLSFGALTEILALALAARNKRSLSDEGKKVGTERQFLGQPLLFILSFCAQMLERNGSPEELAVERGMVKKLFLGCVSSLNFESLMWNVKWCVISFPWGNNFGKAQQRQTEEPRQLIFMPRLLIWNWLMIECSRQTEKKLAAAIMYSDIRKLFLWLGSMCV